MPKHNSPSKSKTKSKTKSKIKDRQNRQDVYMGSMFKPRNIGSLSPRKTQGTSSYRRPIINPIKIGSVAPRKTQGDYLMKGGAKRKPRRKSSKRKTSRKLPFSQFAIKQYGLSTQRKKRRKSSKRKSKTRRKSSKRKSKTRRKSSKRKSKTRRKSSKRKTKTQRKSSKAKQADSLLRHLLRPKPNTISPEHYYPQDQLNFRSVQQFL